jgi:glycosyltransferase involved in cell wall biosynthesis
MHTLSVVIPIYNEDLTIRKVLQTLLMIELAPTICLEYILIDDCSSDNSVKVIDQFIEANPDEKITLIQHSQNKGKGAALRTGFKIASGDYIIIQDADLEYDPNEFDLLLQPILDGHADVVYGSRFVGGKPHRILFFWHSIGNKFLTMMSNVATNLNLTDMETCYKLFKADIIKNIDLKENRFGFEPEVTAKIARIPGIRIYEVGISYYGRTYAEGKKINWKDGFRALYCIVMYGFLRR